MSQTTPFVFPTFNSKKIQLGISACVLGQKVRFDGGHKRSSFALRDLGPYVSYQAICPEMAIGMETPRPAIRQVIKDEQIQVQGSANAQINVTQELQQFSQQQASQLKALSGYIVCAKSPSCGMERVKQYDEQGKSLNSNGVGVFTRALMEANPLLPVEENGRLSDPVLRENFINRVFAYHHWQCLAEQGLTRKVLIEFHSQYKLLVMASSPQAYRELGKLLGDMAQHPLESVAAEYVASFMQALKCKANRKRHTNVLQHLQGYFKRSLPSSERQALSETIHQYRQGLLPLMAPMTLIRHLLVKFPNSYLSQQKYLNPHPERLALRSAL